MMDRDTVVRMAKEAAKDGDHFDFDSAWGIRFATLIQNETLERAAKVCESIGEGTDYDKPSKKFYLGCESCSDAIRALKE